MTLRMPIPLRIVQQPADAAGALGETVRTSVSAEGDGLTYLWYYKDPGKTRFSKGTVKKAVYSMKLSESNDGRQVYCIVSDGFGNSVQSEIATLAVRKPLQIVGDVNGDGAVDARDLTALARHVAKIELITDKKLLSAADVTGNGSVDAADLTKLARYVARIIDSLE